MKSTIYIYVTPVHSQTVLLLGLRRSLGTLSTLSETLGF